LTLSQSSGSKSGDIELVAQNIELISASIEGVDRVTLDWFLDLHRNLMDGSEISSEHLGAVSESFGTYFYGCSGL